MYACMQVMIWDDHQAKCIGELSFRSQVGTSTRGVQMVLWCCNMQENAGTTSLGRAWVLHSNRHSVWARLQGMPAQHRAPAVMLHNLVVSKSAIESARAGSCCRQSSWLHEPTH